MLLKHIAVLGPVLGLMAYSAGATVHHFAPQPPHAGADGSGHRGVTPILELPTLMVNRGLVGQTDFLHSVCPLGRCWDSLLGFLGLETAASGADGAMVPSPIDWGTPFKIAAQPPISPSDTVDILLNFSLLLSIFRNDDNAAGPSLVSSSLAQSVFHTNLHTEATDKAMIQITPDYLQVRRGSQEKASILSNPKHLQDLGITNSTRVSCDRGCICHIAEASICPNLHVEPALSGTSNGFRIIHLQGSIYIDHCDFYDCATCNCSRVSGSLDSGLSTNDCSAPHGLVDSIPEVWNPIVDAAIITNSLLLSHKPWGVDETWSALFDDLAGDRNGCNFPGDIIINYASHTISKVISYKPAGRNVIWIICSI